ncbi:MULTISPECIES: MBL fold metallo-hydrolase [unclassified Saccharicrinis]|uniref:MBL fold metallo-hydrolase n=1 Tax=unclassified Saccharicrinis TaxID=2646859 RepID=UPI003D33DBFC
MKTPSSTLFLGGDSGYDNHFAQIEERFGPFDLALLENGQYEARRYIHMHPDEVLKAASDLKTENLLPGHCGKFDLANHARDTPLNPDYVLEVRHEHGKYNKTRHY